MERRAGWKRALATEATTQHIQSDVNGKRQELAAELRRAQHTFSQNGAGISLQEPQNDLETRTSSTTHL